MVTLGRYNFFDAVHVHLRFLVWRFLRFLGNQLQEAHQGDTSAHAPSTFLLKIFRYLPLGLMYVNLPSRPRLLLSKAKHQCPLQAVALAQPSVNGDREIDNTALAEMEDAFPGPGLRAGWMCLGFDTALQITH